MPQGNIFRSERVKCLDYGYSMLFISYFYQLLLSN